MSSGRGLLLDGVPGRPLPDRSDACSTAPIVVVLCGLPAPHHKAGSVIRSGENGGDEGRRRFGHTPKRPLGLRPSALIVHCRSTICAKIEPAPGAETIDT